MTDITRGVLVGYDGSDGAKQALDWALREAMARGSPLTVCHVWEPGYATMLSHAASVARARGEGLLAEAVRHAHAVARRVDTRPLLLSGPPTRTLCERSDTADLVVLGSRGSGGVSGLAIGSVGMQVAAHAPAPVTIARGRWRPAPGQPAGAVAVGGDGSARADAAVALAFEEAALHDVPLLAVCALADSAGVLGGAGRVKDSFEESLDKAEAAHPDVIVYRLTERGTPRTALLASSAQAQLLVVGARGRGGLRGMALGSVCMAMLHYAACPVIVARDQDCRRPPAGESVAGCDSRPAPG